MPTSPPSRAGGEGGEVGSFRSFGAVFRAALLTVLDALRVKNAAQDVVAHSRQVLDAAAPDHNHRVLLKVVAFPRNVPDDLEPVGQTHLRDLAQRRIRLLGRGGVDARAYAPLLRRLLQGGHLFAGLLRHPWLADQLVDRRHRQPSPSVPSQDPAPRPSRRIPVKWRATNPSRRTQNQKTASRARPRTDVFATEDHDTAACGAVAVMPSHPTVRCQRQRLNFIDRGPGARKSRQKSLSLNSLSFNDGFSERPFRLAKFTACRKKFAFLSAQRHKVKAPNTEKGKISMQQFCHPRR